MMFIARWALRLFLKDVLLEYGPQIVATLVLAVVILVTTTMWALAIMAQPGGIYWLAAQAPPEIQAKHPLVPISQQGNPLVVAVGVPVPVISTSVSAEPIVAAAMTWLRTPYLWGGCTRQGVDCSCFVQNVFATVGIRLPRTTVDQIRVATPVTREQATTGDLVFFDNTCQNCGANPTHVGLYLGDGMMIDAGDPVRVEPVYGGHNARFGRVLR